MTRHPPPRLPLPALLALFAATAASNAAAQSAPAAPASEPAPAPPTQAIEITGNRESATDERRRSTAARIVIGRDEIDKFGDSTIGDVLRRLPGVTTPGAPGRGGAPRLRGLGNGYTQLLLDGQRVPAGFSLESIAPDQIERIEILRAPTAETGARAIAGTINIVTREGYKRRSNELRLGTQVENGVWSPGISWTRNDSFGEAFLYNLSLSAANGGRQSLNTLRTTDTDNASDTVTLAQTETTRADERRPSVNLTGRLQWRLGGAGDSLLLTPTFFHNTSRSTRDATLVQDVPATPPRYDSAHVDGSGGYTNARLNAQWRQRVGPASRLEIGGAVGGFRARGDSLRDEFLAGTPQRTLLDDTTTRERSGNVVMKLAQTLGGSDDDPLSVHAVTSGVEAEAARRHETRVNSQLDGGDGDNLQATSVRLAAYVQDEWNLGPQWALHAGLRWEGIAVRGNAADGSRPSNRSRVWTPLAHAVWKPDPKGRDQLRLSLTRSWRSPALSALIAQPSINARYPAPGANRPTAPDRAGNPDLQPETALGVDLAHEHYLDGGGVVSAGVFRREIRNLMRSVVALETVDYSPGVPRYVARQRNLGKAVTEGVELDARMTLDRLVAAAPRVDLHANLSVFRSRVAGVPGPDDRLDQQAKGTANLGADHRFRGTPLTLGGNLNLVPGYATQLAADQRTRTGSKRVVDVYGLWSFGPQAALRLSAVNAAPRGYASSNTIVADTYTETARTGGPSYTNWQLRLELKL